MPQLTISTTYLDWLAVFGYIAFAAFVAWAVFNTKPRD